MANDNVHDTIPCPPPEDDEHDAEQERLQRLAELIELCHQARSGELKGEPDCSTIAGVRVRLAVAA